MTKNSNQFRLTKYFKKHAWGILAYSVVQILAAVCSIFMTLLFAHSMETLTAGEYKKTIYLFLIGLGLSVFRRLMWLAMNSIFQVVGNRFVAEVNHDLAERAFKLNSQTYAEHDTGTFVQRIVHDPNLITGALANIITDIIEFISQAVVLIYISTLNVYIAIIIVGVIALSMVIEYFRVKTRRKNRKNVRKLQDKINSLTTEIVRSEKDIKALGLENALSSISKANYENVSKTSQKTELTDIGIWSLRNFLIETMGIVMLILGIHFIDIGTMTLATFMIVYSNNHDLYDIVWRVGNILSSFTDMKISADRMVALFDEKEFVSESFGERHLERVEGNIEFKNVGYSYREYEEVKGDKKSKKKPERKLASTNKVLENLSFEIKPHTTVAFVGRSGSGKSTILNLVSKMYVVDEGEILIDGVNINELDKESLRNNISLVNQFPYIFDMTIKENLLLANKDATDADIANALDKASLTEFIASLPKGVESKVGESGIKLSGGQKQRLAIARAFLRNSPIIIFDESTSSLDNFAQGDIKKSIDALKGKSTIVIVAHRLSTIRDVDVIFFLEEGKIVDKGNFDYLFSNNEKFKNMFYAENLDN